jgi:hypothetical protein
MGISFGDYDNDGDEDALLYTLDWRSTSAPAINLYDNDGRGHFTRNANINFKGHLKASNAWADYDRDGDLDFVAHREKSGDCYSNYIVVFENNGDKTFTPVEFPSLTGLNSDYLNYTGDLEWGDYDNDGYPDILLAGQHTCGNGTSINRIYHNNGNKTFSPVSNLVQISYDANVDWADYDNDGDLDVFAYGDPFGAYSERTRIYRNDDGKFRETDIHYLLSSYQGGKTARGDIDHDGDLDYVILGESTYTNQKIIAYKNTYAESWGRKNHKPSAPQNLHYTVPADLSVTLSWDAADDAETAQDGLTYNLYVLDENDSIIVNSYSTDNGSRMIVSPGNASGAQMTLKNLKPGTYRWAVQAIDKGYESSVFSVVHTFEVEPASPITSVDDALLAGLQLYPNPVANHLTVVSRQQPEAVQLQILNAVGMPAGYFTLDKPEVTYDMSPLPSGLYIVMIYRNGTRVGMKKVIKK